MRSSSFFGYRPYHRTGWKESGTPLNKRRLIAAAVAIALIAGAVFLMDRLRTSGFRWDLLADALKSVHSGWLSASIGMILLSYAGRVLRWRAMIRGVAPSPGLWNLLSATLVGFTAVVFFGRPGEFVRPYLIAKKESVPVSSQMAAWLVERIYDLLIVLALFGFALTRVDGMQGLGPNLRLILKTGGYLAGMLAAGCLAFLVLSSAFAGLARRLVGWVTGRLPSRLGDRLRTIALSFMDAVAFAGSPRVVVELILYSVLEWTIIVAGIYFLFQSYAATAPLSLLDVLIFTGFVAFGGAVQLPGIGGGMQAAAVLVLTELFGLGIESSTGMALFLWAVTWLVVVPFGMLLAFHEGLKWGNLKHVKQEVEG